MENARKKPNEQLETKLSTIARKGRAFGIHLILATAAFTMDGYGYVTAQMKQASANRMNQLIRSISTG